MISFLEGRQRQKVTTRLGRGEVIHVLKNGKVVVELEHGDGHIFYPEEVRCPRGRELTDLTPSQDN